MKKKLYDFPILKAPVGKKINLSKYDPGFIDHYRSKKHAERQLVEDVQRLADLQTSLYAENRRGLLIIFQAMDGAGKDSAIKHVMSGVNPQGCEVTSFKHPSEQELGHDYLWRHTIALPDRGRIAIFNRSHYENVLISKVHPELLEAERLPGIYSPKDLPKNFWDERYRQINEFERTIIENGTTILKFFLHLSKDEQRKRFLERIEKPSKNWKFSYGDITERDHWEEYQKAYEDAISNTSTHRAPWYIIPADHKWFTQAAIGNIIVRTLEEMDIKMPRLSDEERSMLAKAKKELKNG